MRDQAKQAVRYNDDDTDADANLIYSAISRNTL